MRSDATLETLGSIPEGVSVEVATYDGSGYLLVWSKGPYNGDEDDVFGGLA